MPPRPLHAPSPRAAADQPTVVADMGCGDGTLLKTIYQYVVRSTKRGKSLDEHPLTMCGVDFNRDSLAQTGATLSAAGVPHALMFGDIGDPAPMQAELEATLGVTRDGVLHVRSFLDHDRPFIPPTADTDVCIAAALDASSDATYVSNMAGGARIDESHSRAEDKAM